MKKPRPILPDPSEDDPRRRLGLTIRSSDEEMPETTRADKVKGRLAILGAILLILILAFMMFMDSIENFQCRPWEYVTFQCDRFDAQFKSWEGNPTESTQ